MLRLLVFSSPAPPRPALANATPHKNIVKLSSKMASCSLRPLLRRLPTAAATPPSALQTCQTTATATRPSQASAARSYVTRAHSKPVVQYPILDAIDRVLEGIAERKAKRQQRWDKYGEKIAAKKGLSVSQFNVYDIIILGSLHACATRLVSHGGPKYMVEHVSHASCCSTCRVILARDFVKHVGATPYLMVFAHLINNNHPNKLPDRRTLSPARRDHRNSPQPQPRSSQARPGPPR